MAVIKARISSASMLINENLNDFAHKKIVTCKFCNSMEVVKYGTFEGMQRYFCKNCHRKFADNDALPKMKTPIWIISLALNSFYNGLTLGEIQKLINQRHGAIYAQSGIFNWIVRFSKSAIEQEKSFLPKTGSIWLLVQDSRETGNKKIWFQDIFDTETRFLLASSVSESSEEISDVFKKALARAGKPPNQPINVTLCGNFKSRRRLRNTVENLNTSQNIALVNSCEGENARQFILVLKSRKQVIRGFKNMSTAQLFIEAWQVHYNFIGRSENNLPAPPAMKMGKIPFKNWTELVANSSKVK